MPSHAHRVEEQRLPAVFGVRAHQRVDTGRRQTSVAFLADPAERARAVFAEIDMNGLQPIYSLLRIGRQIGKGVVHVDVLRVAAAGQIDRK